MESLVPSAYCNTCLHLLSCWDINQLDMDTKKLSAEFLGTFVLVLGGCGSAIFAAPVIGILGVSLAFGLTVLCMAYAVGHISGGHFNPAVSIGLMLGGRFSSKDLAGYIIAQVLGAATAAGIIYLIASGKDGFQVGGFASNGFGDNSPEHYSLVSALVCEFVMTFVFLIIILGATDSRAPKGFAPLPIGLGLVLIHLVSIPITNTSVNPARSTSQAIFAGGIALEQLWLFWLAPIAGAALAGIVYKMLEAKK
jgi:aquaporin Z